MRNLKAKNFTTKLTVPILIVTLLFIGFTTFATTYYSAPGAVTLTGQATGGTATSSGWSTDPLGVSPAFGTVTIVQTDNIIIQAGSIVTTTTGGGQTVANITFNGGSLVLAASSFNCQGNITGTGTYSNATGLTTRINMNGSNKTLSAVLTGNAGFSIVNNITLAGNTSIGGKLTIGNSTNTTPYTFNLAGFNISADNIYVYSVSKIKGSGIENVVINGISSGTATTNTSQLYFDMSLLGFSNSIASLTLNNPGHTKLFTAVTVGTLTMNAGNFVLGSSDVTVTNTIQGGSSLSYIATDNKLADGTANGSVSCPVSAGVRKLIPVGTFTSTYTGSTGNSYDPVAVTPSATTVFTVHLKNAFTNPVFNAAKATGREWNISSSAPSATLLELTPRYPLQASATPIPVIGHYNGTAWEEISATRVDSTWSATVSSFSPFGVGTEGGFIDPLPIRLSHFSAIAKKGTVLLNWNTENEFNNAGFDIERSANGINYTRVGHIAGKGTSAQTEFYEFADVKPLFGNSYYRLKQLDHSGAFSYSAVQLIRMNKGAFYIQNTLVSDVLKVSANENESVSISILNATGQRLRNETIKGQQQINVAAFAPGMYIIRAADGTTSRFVKL